MLFAVQWIFNFGWTGFFFGMQAPGLALIEIAMLWVMIGAMIVRFARHDRVAAALLVPYAMWVSFAMMLNAAIWQLNG